MNTIPCQVEAALRVDATGDLYTGSWHGECFRNFCEDQSPEFKAMIASGEMWKAGCEVPITMGFVIDGEFFDREQTALRLHMDCYEAESGDVAEHVFGEASL